MRSCRTLGLSLTLALCLLTFLMPSSALQAQVVLPETGRLAGPMNTEATHFGNGFLFFPFPPGLPTETFLTGWVEIQFLPPEDGKARFAVTLSGVGTEAFTEFLTGQRYEFTGDELITLGGGGVLDLETGEIEDFVLAVAFVNSVISEFGKINRIAGFFGHVYPPNLAGLPLPPLPPGFTFAEAAFMYRDDGTISGFDFAGRSLSPVGAFAFSPTQPPYAFSPNSRVTFPNPTSCAPGAECPDDPDGFILPFEAILHPSTFVYTDELDDVPVAPEFPACAPDARSGALAVTSGGKIYHLGGAYKGPDRGKVSVYDPMTDVWEDGPRMPVPVIDAQGAAMGEKIYVFGGRRFPRSPALAILQVLDTSTGTWSQLASAPLAIADAVAAAMADQLYVIGGRTNRPNGSPSGSLRLADTLQIYDPASDSWQLRPATVGGEPLFVADAAVLTQSSDIYVVGGRTLGNELSDRTVELNVVTDRFTEGPRTRRPVYDAVGGRVGRRLYLAGGRSSVGGPSDAGVEVLELERGEWLRAHDQPFPTASSATAVIGGRLYVIGGDVMAGADAFPGRDTAVVQTFDPARGWQTCRETPLFNAGDVFSMASLTAGPEELSPGALATIRGRFLAAGSERAPDGEDVPTELGGVEILVDGENAPILAVGPRRIDFQIPYTASGRSVTIALVRDDLSEQAPSVEVPFADAVPSVFIQSCGNIDDPLQLDGAFALACQVDTLNYASNTVAPGQPLTLQMSGLGAVDSALDNGQRAPAGSMINALQVPIVRVETEDGQMAEATVLSAVLAGGEVGIYDVEILVPDNARQGNRVRIEAQIGDLVSNPAVISVGDVTVEEPVPCLRDTNPLFRACRPL